MAVVGGLALLGLACHEPTPIDRSGPVAEWPEYGGDKGGLRYSPLSQITRENVGALEIAWVHHHGDISDGSDGSSRTSFNATPIVADGLLYFCTGFNRVIALDPETGEERWSFDPRQRLRKLQGPYPRTCRGVAYWKDTRADPTQPCARRIFTGTLDSELIALDARTGRPCQDFGVDGRVALREGIGAAPAWEYYVTSPPLVIRGHVVLGALVADNLRTDAPSGVVRAFDARSGALRWAWDPVPPGHPPTQEGYRRGTPNVWSILSGDEEHGLVFVPTGNASPDYFAGLRGGLDHYASSTVALEAETGKVRWHFQTVHHDLWDYDVASQPTLFRIPTVAGGVPALVQATKMGHLFLLHRMTGLPLYPVEERPVPGDGVPGETLSPTQPFPTHPPPLHPATLSPNDAWGFTPWDRGRCAKRIAELRSEGIFTPPSLRGSVQYPGPVGGANWGSVAIDPEAAVLYVNQSRVASMITLIPREAYEKLDEGENRYPNELYPQLGTPYGLRREPLLSPLGAPCNPPPWGTLTAVDLVSGKTIWESTLGTTRDQAPFPVWLPLGSPNLGGSIVTAGGLVFIGATTDRFLRAFDAETGEELWRRRLPYTANATPLTYRLRRDARQYIVIAAGGHGWSEPGDALMAFALPQPD
ncbi:MAG: pyrroloquinoline quinone-dependent dehydrogenase [Myxococcota bacterium]